MTPRVRMIRETEEFLERELDRDTIPCLPVFEEDEEEDALLISASEILNQTGSGI